MCKDTVRTLPARGARKASTDLDTVCPGEREREGRLAGWCSLKKVPQGHWVVFKPRSAVIKVQLPPDTVMNFRASTARNDVEYKINTSKLLS